MEEEIKNLSNEAKELAIVTIENQGAGEAPDAVAGLAGFTPGRWVADGNGVHVGTQCVAITYAPDAPAKARLIAAAPALYEALKELEEMYQASGTKWEAARAALTLATGQRTNTLASSGTT